MPFVIEIHLRRYIRLLIAHLHPIIEGICLISWALLATSRYGGLLLHFVIYFLGFDPILLDLVNSNV